MPTYRDAELDAVVVGSGPNGLAAAVTLARAGLAVRLYEQADTLGGGMRTAELTEPGYRHDVCSAVHPMAFASGFFRRFGLRDRVEFVVPDAAYAHPLADGQTGVAYRSLDSTAESLGADGTAWRALFAPLVDGIRAVAELTGSSLLRIPRHPLTSAQFAARVAELGMAPGAASGRLSRFSGPHAPAMLAGLAAHSGLPQPSLAAAGVGLALGSHAHAEGWPIPVGGSQAIADALVDDFVAHGGEVVAGHRVASLRELPNTRIRILDVGTASLLKLAANELPPAYARALRRMRPGIGAAKLDLAVSAPIPWRNPDIAAASTIHLGGSAEQIAAAERSVNRGQHAERPVVLVSQPSLFDSSRAPAGRHTVWAYAHVPNGSTRDLSEHIIGAIEDQAPGFRDTILASASRTAAELGQYNPNYPGGDIASGAASMAQILARPVLSPNPWAVPLPGTYLASSATAPGPGVHGLSGYYAARLALARELNLTPPALGPTE